MKPTGLISAIIVLLSWAGAGHTAGRVIEVYPSNADSTCNEEFQNVTNTLEPGDILILHGGIYSQSCRRLITGRHGTETQPIVIQAGPGESPILTRPGNAQHSYSQNNIEIENSSYLVIRGLKFRGGDVGVRFMGDNRHITFEENEVYETGANALSMNSGDSDSMIIRRNHIHHTGLDTSGTTVGEGLYLGCNNDTCRVTDSLIEGNYIHHLRATNSGGNDGIEVKVGSYGNVIRDNVIHDTNIGTRYPCIFVYGGGTSMNIVEGNAMWNCGEAIYTVSDAIVRNNIVMGSDTGIASYPHVQVAQMKNLTIVNNTVYGSGQCLQLGWSSVTNALLANNAVYCPNTTAVNGSGLSSAQVAARANYVKGAMFGASLDSLRFFDGGSADSAFVSPATSDFWPASSSILRDNAVVSYSPALDFNNTPRASPIDVGAYETNGQLVNPGWRIQAGFKGHGVTDNTAPTVSITAPVDGSRLKRKSTVTITASASDQVGVTRVEFYVNGALACTDTSAAYSCAWKVPASNSIKIYGLDAKAYDAAGNVGVSSTVTVTLR